LPRIAQNGTEPSAPVHPAETNAVGRKRIRRRAAAHDLQATILHLMGIDHERLTYRFQDRDYRLTDVHGKVVNELLA
jgi:hypothetical protein